MQHRRDRLPPEFRALAIDLEQRLVPFLNTVRAGWNGVKGSTKFACDVSLANGNRGPAVFQAGNLAATRTQLDKMLALGFEACALQIQYPLMDTNWEGYDSQYVSYYASVASYAKSIGMTVFAETSPVFSGTVWSGLDVGDYFDSMTNAQYLTRRAAMAKGIDTYVVPDYLSILHEPATEAYLAGKTFTNSEWTTFIADTIALTITAPLGAGVGSWESDLTLYNAILATGIDWANVHVYPVTSTPNPLTQLITMCDLAVAAGKGVSIGECYLYKATVAEYTGGEFGAGYYYYRDIYSQFWEYDSLFFQGLAEFAHWKGLDVVVAFWNRSMFALLDYSNALAAQSTTDQMDQLSTQAYTDMNAGKSSIIGRLIGGFV